MKNIFFILFLFLFSGLLHAEEANLPVKEIKIEGNLRIEKDAIRVNIASKIGEVPDFKIISQDIKRIFGLGHFTDVVVLKEEVSEGLILRYKVTEKKTIKEVLFTGNKEIKSDDLKTALQTNKFSMLDANKVNKDIDKIMQKYLEKGYYLVKVKEKIEDLEENQVRLTYEIEENKPIILKKINFIGNSFFSEEELKSFIETKEGGLMSAFQNLGMSGATYKEEIFDIDKQRILFFYLKNGFINAKVEGPDVSISEDKKWLYLAIKISEGEQYKIKTIDFSGELLKEKEFFADLLTIETGKTFDYEKIQNDIKKITIIYQDEGYAFPNIIPKHKTYEDKLEVDLNFAIEKGLKTYIERINISGNLTTRDKIIRRQMVLVEGDLYNATKLTESEFNLRRLGFFKDVKITHKKGSADDKLELSIEVTEQESGTFTIGAAFNTLENFQFLSQIQKQNLLGYGWTINFMARMGGKSQVFNVNFIEPYLMDTDVSMSVNLFNTESRYNDFSTKVRGGGLSLGYPLYKPYWSVNGGYNFEDVKIEDITDFQRSRFKDGITSSVTMSVDYDTRLRLGMFQTLKGMWVELSTKYAGTVLGGDNSFMELSTKYTYVKPVFDEDLLILGGSKIEFRTKLNYIFSVTDTPVPLHERYFPGGINSMRGYGFRSLGPFIYIASNSDPQSFVRKKFGIGGNKEFICNLEYILPIFKEQSINLVSFYDLGNAYNTGEWINPMDLRHGAGLGIRWYSPIGPLRFEWGFPIGKKEDEEGMVFEFSIGEFF